MRSSTATGRSSPVRRWATATRPRTRRTCSTSTRSTATSSPWKRWSSIWWSSPGTEEDPYAGLLIPMHGAGIYRQRYRPHPPPPLLTQASAHKPVVDAFVAEQESGYGERIAAIGAAEEERWHDFGLLELYDRLS